MKLSRLAKAAIDIILWICVGAASIALILRLNDERAAAVIASTVLTAAILFCARVLKLELLCPPMVYLMLLGAFHLGLVVPWSLGFYDGLWTRDLHRADLVPALVLFVMAVVSFQVGSSVAARLQKTAVETPPSRNVGWIEDKTLFFAGIGLLALAAATYVWGLRQLFGGAFSALALPRMEYWQTLQTGETWLYTFGAVFTLIGFYIALCGASRRQVGFVIAIVAIWGISNLWVGERSDPMIATVTVLWLLKKKGAVIAKKLFIAGVLAAMLVIPMVRVVRGEVATRRLQAIDWAELTPVAALAEMGTTIGVLAESYRLVGPSQFRGGRTYVHAFRGVLPRKFFPHLVRSEADDMELSPAAWYVWTTQPNFARIYGGCGFSSVAEAYINFGEVGVCLVFLALGFFFFRMESLAGRGAFSLAAYGIIFPPLVWTVRNDFSIVPRSVLWGLAVLAVVKLLSQAYRRPERVAKQAPAGGLLRASPSPIPRA